MKSDSFYIVNLGDSFEKEGHIDVSKQPKNNIYIICKKRKTKLNIKEILGEGYFPEVKIIKGDIIEIYSFFGIEYRINLNQNKILSKRVTK